jgi:hypothetical protein
LTICVCSIVQPLQGRSRFCHVSEGRRRGTGQPWAFEFTLTNGILLGVIDYLEPDAVRLREFNGPDLYPRPDSVPDSPIVVMLLDAGADVNVAWGDDIEIAETPHVVGAKWPLPKEWMETSPCSMPPTSWLRLAVAKDLG